MHPPHPPPGSATVGYANNTHTISNVHTSVVYSYVYIVTEQF